MLKPNLPHLNSTEQQGLTEFVRRLQKQFNGLIQSVLLFGSKARRDSTPDSDLDVLIIVDSNDWQLHKKICYLAADICLEYDLNLSPRIWSVSHLREMEEMGASLYRNIQRDGISLLERTPA